MSLTGENDTMAATRIASSADPSMLRQITTAIAQVTGSRSTYMKRYEAGTRDAEIVAACGPDAPEVGERVSHADDPREAVTLPLSMDGRPIGAIVCVATPRAVVLDPTHPGQIELLMTLAASALHNLSLVRELELASAAAAESRFRLLNGLVLYLKNTLGAAGEYVQLIETESELTTRQRGYIGASQRNISVAVRLLTEVIDLGRVETGRLAVQTGTVDPGRVIRGIVRDYELLNGTSGVRFVIALPNALPLLETDVDLMRRVLDTLMSNAVKYTAAGGRVCITGEVRAGRRAGDPQQWVCITVRDDGPGVAERDHVFEEVMRAESTTSAPGFRLAISRRIARLLGGDLSLDTRAAEGSSFSFWLPLPSPLLLEEHSLANEHGPLERADTDLGPALAERH